MHFIFKVRSDSALVVYRPVYISKYLVYSTSFFRTLQLIRRLYRVAKTIGPVPTAGKLRYL
jgi:hypothetical protein